MPKFVVQTTIEVVVQQLVDAEDPDKACGMANMMIGSNLSLAASLCYGPGPKIRAKSEVIGVPSNGGKPSLYTPGAG